MSINGLLTDVRWEWDGTELTADASATDTVLPVLSATAVAVDEQVWINFSGPYTITEIDEENDTVTITPGLDDDYEEGTEVVPDVGGYPAQVWVAEVVLPDAEKPIEVPLTIKDLSVMPEGEYNPPVAIILSDDMESVIDLPGSLPVLDGAYIPEDSLPPVVIPDPDPPLLSPTPTPAVGPAAVIVNYISTISEVVDLYVWVPPEDTPDDTPPTITDATYLHTTEFPNGGFVYTDAFGTPLPADRAVWVALWARNAGGAAPAPSDWVETGIGQIPPEYMELLAGTVLAKRLQGETVTGVYLNGAYLDIENSLIAGPNYLQVFADAIEAQSAIFEDNVTRYGTNNYLVGRETAAAGVTDPGNPPSVTNAWTSRWSTASILRDIKRDPDSSSPYTYYALRQNDYVYEIDIDTGATVGAAKLVEMFFDTRHSIAKVPSGGSNPDWYALERIYNFFGDDDIVITRYDDSTTPWTEVEQTVILTGANVSGNRMAMAYYNNRLWVVFSNASGQTKLIEWNPSTKAVVANRPLPGTPTVAKDFVGLFLNSAGEVWAQPSDTSRRGWDWNGSSWDNIGAGQTRPYGQEVVATLAGEHSDIFDDYSMVGVDGLFYKLEYPTPSSRTYTYTWYDSDSGGSGTAESKASDGTVFTPQLGASVLVNTPLPPDDGTNDAPNTVRIYIDNHLQAPHYDEGTELGVGRKFSEFSVSNPDVAQVTLISAGAPSTSGFDSRPATIPGGSHSGKTDSSSVPYWYMYGDGSERHSRFTQAGVVATGTMVANTTKSLTAITFDVPFPTGQVPAIQLSIEATGGIDNFDAIIRSVSETTLNIDARRISGTGSFNVHWHAQIRE